MLRTGRVVSAKNGELEVCFQRPEACAHCTAACGGQAHETLVTIPGDAPVGRWIDVDMPEGQVLKASALAYVLPLILLLLGLWIGSLIFAQEALWAVTGIACMLLSWFVLRLLDRRMRRRGPWQPKIVAVHEEGDFSVPS